MEPSDDPGSQHPPLPRRWQSQWPAHRRDQLKEDGVLVPGEEGLLQFADDQAFSSPSAAAAVVTGRTSDGRKEWVLESTGQSYGAWQEAQVDTASADTYSG